jgi:outer membrane protein assembly factor BamB
MVLVGACDKKVPLPGKREPIIGVTIGRGLLQADNNAASAGVVVSPAVTNEEHVDDCGSKQHVSVNHKMPRKLRVLWGVPVGSGPINSGIIAFGGKVYSIDSSGMLICADQKTGSIIWRKKVAAQPDDGIFSGGMTANNGILYIGTNIGTVVAVDSKTRKELWSQNVQCPTKGAPLFVYGKIVVNTADSQTYALDSTNGKVLWVKAMNKEQTQMAGAGSPSVFENCVICGYSSGDVAALGIADGFDKWIDVLFPGNISDSGSAMQHIGGSPVVDRGQALVVTAEDKMVLFDAASGARLWEKDIGTAVTPVVHNDWIFMLTNDGTMVCVSMKDGAVKWAVDASAHCKKKDSKFSVDHLVGPLLINGDVVLFGNRGEIMYFDATSGSIKKVERLEKVYIGKTPIVAGEKMFMISEDGKLYCVGGV